MKKKNLNLKKLTLNKATVSLLNEHAQGAVVGGDNSVTICGSLCEDCIRPITVTCRASVCQTYCNIPTCMGISK